MKRARKMLDKEAVRQALVQVAHLYYDENLAQKDIARQLGVSRSLIAQYLQRAREAGIVRVQIFDPNSTCESLASTLAGETGVGRVLVIPTPHGSEALAARAVAEAAAEFLVDRIEDGDALGLAWGRMTSLVVDLLKPPHVRDAMVFPLMGESGHSGMHSQMNQLVMRAAERLQATPHFLSLPMVVSTPALRDALMKETGIRDVTTRWNHINLACVGIGVVPPVPGMVVYIGDEHLPRLVKAGAVGDVCGIYFDGDGRIIESGLEDRIIGISASQMKAVDCLLGVACGAEKATAVLGAMRSGMLSAVVMDQALAERILAGLRAVDARKVKRRGTA